MSDIRATDEELHILLNLPITEIKALILKYRDTKNPALFSLLVFRFEPFLMQMVKYFKKKFSFFLAKEDSQELMNISILAMNKAFLSMKDNWKYDALYLRIGSYIKQELFNYYRVDIKESNIGTVASPEWLEDNALEYVYGDELIINEVDMNIFLEGFVSLKGKVKHYDLLIERYIKGTKYKDLVKSTGIKEITLKTRVAKALEDCRKLLKTMR